MDISATNQQLSQYPITTNATGTTPHLVIRENQEGAEAFKNLSTRNFAYHSNRSLGANFLLACQKKGLSAEKPFTLEKVLIPYMRSEEGTQWEIPDHITVKDCEVERQPGRTFSGNVTLHERGSKLFLSSNKKSDDVTTVTPLPSTTDSHTSLPSLSVTTNESLLPVKNTLQTKITGTSYIVRGNPDGVTLLKILINEERYTYQPKRNLGANFLLACKAGALRDDVPITLSHVQFSTMNEGTEWTIPENVTVVDCGMPQNESEMNLKGNLTITYPYDDDRSKPIKRIVNSTGLDRKKPPQPKTSTSPQVTENFVVLKPTINQQKKDPTVSDSNKLSKTSTLAQQEFVNQRYHFSADLYIKAAKESLLANEEIRQTLQNNLMNLIRLINTEVKAPTGILGFLSDQVLLLNLLEAYLSLQSQSIFSPGLSGEIEEFRKTVLAEVDMEAMKKSEKSDMSAMLTYCSATSSKAEKLLYVFAKNSYAQKQFQTAAKYLVIAYHLCSNVNNVVKESNSTGIWFDANKDKSILQSWSADEPIVLNDAEIALRMAQLTEREASQDPSFKHHIAYYQMAAQLGHPEAISWFEKYLPAQDQSPSFEKPQNDSDWSSILYAIGMMLFTGKKDTKFIKNTDMAIQYLTQAKQHGNIEAAYVLGLIGCAQIWAGRYSQMPEYKMQLNKTQLKSAKPSSMEREITAFFHDEKGKLVLNAAPANWFKPMNDMAEGINWRHALDHLMHAVNHKHPLAGETLVKLIVQLRPKNLSSIQNELDAAVATGDINVCHALLGWYDSNNAISGYWVANQTIEQARGLVKTAAVGHVTGSSSNT